MPRSSSPALARRALIEDIRADKVGWARHGIAALAVSVLGLGVAGSVMLTGNAVEQQRTTRPVLAAPTIAAPVVTKRKVEAPSAFDRDTSRGTERPTLSAAKVKSMAAQRAEALSKAEDKVDAVAQTKAMKARENALAKAAAATQKRAEQIKAAGVTKTSQASTPKTTSTDSTTTTGSTSGSGSASLPVTGGYTIAARFGAVGSWSRYHTGFDFAAPVGTPIHAPTSGVVTNAGGGPASGWAGNYVAIRHPNGTSTLYAHMSTVSVSVGQTVSGGQVIGAIGMTGRTFGPHVHFEVYPAGVTPGDVYRAVNPQPWLQSLGLHP